MAVPALLVSISGSGVSEPVGHNCRITGGLEQFVIEWRPWARDSGPFFWCHSAASPGSPFYSTVIKEGSDEARIN